MQQISSEAEYSSSHSRYCDHAVVNIIRCLMPEACWPCNAASNVKIKNVSCEGVSELSFLAVKELVCVDVRINVLPLFSTPILANRGLVTDSVEIAVQRLLQKRGFSLQDRFSSEHLVSQPRQRSFFIKDCAGFRREHIIMNNYEAVDFLLDGAPA